METKKAEAIMELVAGYDAYATAGEFEVAAVADPPETTWICSVGVSWISGRFVSHTVVHNC